MNARTMLSPVLLALAVLAACAPALTGGDLDALLEQESRQEDRLVWAAGLLEAEAVAIERARSFDAMLASAYPQELRPGVREIVLRDITEADGRVAAPVVLLSNLIDRGEPAAVLVLSNARGAFGLDPDPGSVHGRLQLALIEALDARFRRM